MSARDTHSGNAFTSHSGGQMRNRAGFTMIEMLIVMVIFAVLTAVALPKLGKSRNLSNVSSAKTQIAMMLSTAKGAAVSRGSNAIMRRTGNTIWVSGTTTADTIVRPQALGTLYGVTISVPTGSDSVLFDARGMAQLSTQTRFVITRQTKIDTVCVTRGGAIMQKGCL